ncbi:hypothetical protein DFA_06009 [Cavenderia fasciculata]|uniref:GATA-type domain-containing protein n=1 Tax=Cavenderia fasciculata TaxID=261658 RepID=F4PJU7_CACFS|nr:uncharacterized protein DFA_06009 [Cavenderia fasciculata]EGG23871.1 hypothetical protein DFA_06009 [Cavenderia fasciculata]|eukprot:XP_004361722.1 hypothetical protein DFA_06009 [Cavenderia fasciculata]
MNSRALGDSVRMVLTKPSGMKQNTTTITTFYYYDYMEYLSYLGHSDFNTLWKNEVIPLASYINQFCKECQSPSTDRVEKAWKINQELNSILTKILGRMKSQEIPTTQHISPPASPRYQIPQTSSPIYNTITSTTSTSTTSTSTSTTTPSSPKYPLPTSPKYMAEKRVLLPYPTPPSSELPTPSLPLSTTDHTNAFGGSSSSICSSTATCIDSSSSSIKMSMSSSSSSSSTTTKRNLRVSLPSTQYDDMHHQNVSRAVPPDMHDQYSGGLGFRPPQYVALSSSMSNLNLSPRITTQQNVPITSSINNGKAAKPRGRPRKIRPTSCAICNCTSTPEWRKGDNGANLCNACGLQYMKKLRTYGSKPFLPGPQAPLSPTSSSSPTTASVHNLLSNNSVKYYEVESQSDIDELLFDSSENNNNNNNNNNNYSLKKQQQQQ